MKPTKQKHGKENTIGKIIYEFLLFMPLLAMAVTCAYVIFNKNAYQSYYGENINEKQKQYITSNSDLIDNDNTLYMENSYFINTNLSGTLSYTSCHFETGLFANNTAENIELINSSNRLYFYRGTSITFYNDTTNTSFLMTSISGVVISLNDITSTPLSNIYEAFYYWQFQETSYLSNTFYYAIEEVKQSPLFNWSYNTATYNVLESTCNTLGITNNFVPMILSYWLMMSLMYLLYDIALLIVHMAHNRIHDIESSI